MVFRDVMAQDLNDTVPYLLPNLLRVFIASCPVLLTKSGGIVTIPCSLCVFNVTLGNCFDQQISIGTSYFLLDCY